jgi:hypothetical protein
MQLEVKRREVFFCDGSIGRTLRHFAPLMKKSLIWGGFGPHRSARVWLATTVE